ncbi:MAG: hypothetical protein HQL31_07370 [Planctomycetes bacterium]|nr:hypothetical protein [Planctomycetota bacterium]
MGDQSLKKLIQGANKKVADGGAQLLAKAEAGSWEGSVEVLVGILENFRALFDEQFEAQLPGLKKHLETRDSGNLKMMCEVIHQRLESLCPEKSMLSKAGPESAPTAPAEDDFSDILNQKSVDEMDENERQSIALADGAKGEEAADAGDEDLESLLAGSGADEEEKVSDDGGLDALLAGNDTEDAAPDLSPPSSGVTEEEDFSAILEQKSVDEMNEEERASIDITGQAPPAAKVAPKPEPVAEEDAGGDDLDALLSSEESKGSDLGDDLDSLLSGEESSNSEPEAMPALPPIEDSTMTDSSDDLDALLSGAENAEAGDLPGEDNSGSSDDLDALLSGAEDAEAGDLPGEDNSDSSGDLDALLSDAEDAGSDEASGEGNSGSSDDLDALLSDAEDADSSDLSGDGNPSSSDALDSLLADEGDSSEELSPDTGEGSDDFMEDILSDGEAEQDIEDILSEDSDSRPETETKTPDSVSDEEFEQSQANAEDALDEALLSVDAKFEENLVITDTVVEALDEVDTEMGDSLTQMIETLSDGESNTTTEFTDRDDAMKALESEGDPETADDMLHALGGTDELEETDVDDSNFNDLLSEATGRQITDDDLQATHETMNLDDLVKDAHEHLGEEKVRVISSVYRVEQDGEILFEGEDMAGVEKIIGEKILAGEGKGLEIKKCVTREITLLREDVEKIPLRIKFEIG